MYRLVLSFEYDMTNNVREAIRAILLTLTMLLWKPHQRIIHVWRWRNCTKRN